MKIERKLHTQLAFKDAYELIGGLSTPSKMPWYGWSTPAKACVTGSKLRQSKGTVCSKCYALKGNYMFPNVQRALQRRLVALDHPQFVEAFALVLNTLYERQRMHPRENRFRWHDSGDLRNLDHLISINEIAKLTPQLKHWLPTREFGICKKFKGVVAPNLVIRMSFPLVGGKLSNPDYIQSTVGRDDDPELYQCPASKQGNKCLDCKACWTNENVNYHLH